jgi:hypothetical protein
MTLSDRKHSRIEGCAPIAGFLVSSRKRRVRVYMDMTLYSTSQPGLRTNQRCDEETNNEPAG